MTPVPAPTAPFRLARGCAVAGTGLALAVAAHGVAATGSPEPPTSPLLLLVALLTAAGCVVASAQRWTPVRLVVALAGIQAAAHGALWLDSGSGAVDPRLAGLAEQHAGHVHTAAATSLPMLAAHAAAVVVAALLLARIDDAVALLAGLARRLLVRWTTVPVAPRVLVPAVVREVRPRAARAARGPVARRGPPAVPAPA